MVLVAAGEKIGMSLHSVTSEGQRILIGCRATVQTLAQAVEAARHPYFGSDSKTGRGTV